MDTNSIILDRKIVALPKSTQAVVAKMYSQSVLDDVMLEQITYLSDGLRVKGYLAYPKNIETTYPTLIWNRGGFGERGSLDDLRAMLILASTAQWGYVVLATQYRGNKGGEGVEDWGDADVNDSLKLIDVAEQLSFADSNKIAIEGASRGGMTTYVAMTRESRFKCAITHAGLTDLFALEESYGDFAKWIDKLFGHLILDEKRVELSKRSAVYFADKLPDNIPLLIMHGSSDRVVPISQSENLVKELKKLQFPVQYEVIEGGDHVALKDGSYVKIDQIRQAWLKKHLR